MINKKGSFIIIAIIMGVLFFSGPILADDEQISEYIGKTESELAKITGKNNIKAAMWYPYTYLKENDGIFEIIKMNYVAYNYKNKILVFQFLNNTCIGCNFTKIIYYNNIELAEFKKLTLSRIYKKFGQPFSKGLYDIFGINGKPGQYLFIEYITDRPDTYLIFYFDPVNNKVIDCQLHYNK